MMIRDILSVATHRTSLYEDSVDVMERNYLDLILEREVKGNHFLVWQAKQG